MDYQNFQLSQEGKNNTRIPDQKFEILSIRMQQNSIYFIGQVNNRIWPTVRDQHTSTNISKLRRIQRQPAIFIPGDYKSREVCCVSNTLTKLTVDDPFAVFCSFVVFSFSFSIQLLNQFAARVFYVWLYSLHFFYLTLLKRNTFYTYIISASGNLDFDLSSEIINKIIMDYIVQYCLILP